MSDLIDRAETARRRLGLRQVAVATALGVTQGHYSKVANRRAPLARDLAERLASWVETNASDGDADGDVRSHRIAKLAESIQRQLIELLELAAHQPPHDASDSARPFE